MEGDFRDQVRSGDTLEQAGGSQGGEVVRFELYFEGRVNSNNVSFILKTLWWLPSALALEINSKIMNKVYRTPRHLPTSPAGTVFPLRLSIPAPIFIAQSTFWSLCLG